MRVGDRQIGSLFFSNPQEVNPEDVQVTFDDVRGVSFLEKFTEICDLFHLKNDTKSLKKPLNFFLKFEKLQKCLFCRIFWKKNL